MASTVPSSQPLAGPIGLLHPGEMGAAFGSALVRAGFRVLWVSSGRSPASAQRASVAQLEDVGSKAEMVRESAVILSICPPANAYEVAEAAAGFHGVYVDANAISPRTSKRVADVIEAGGGSYVDGSIIGPPPMGPGKTRLYLSGALASAVSDLFTGTIVAAPVLGDRAGAASALKMAYAGWSKGQIALLLAVREYAVADGVDEALIREWGISAPSVEAQHSAAVQVAAAKGWRWVGEMEEIATAFSDVGVTGEFHCGAAEIFRPQLEARSDYPRDSPG
jgi:3-hydroxyisobutyrate dehydrogenase-like beta-hydroxyacid dehydrogenase